MRPSATSSTMAPRSSRRDIRSPSSPAGRWSPRSSRCEFFAGPDGLGPWQRSRSGLNLDAMKPEHSKASSGLSAEELSILRKRLEHERGQLRARLPREQAVALEAESLPEPMDAAEQTREQDDAVLFSERDRALL